jgi:hypothetical protein
VISFFLKGQVVEEEGNDGEAINRAKYSNDDDEGDAHIARRISRGVTSLDL